LRTKRDTIKLIFLFMTAVVVLVSSAQGQTPDRFDLADYIQRNEELLNEATLLVRGTNSAKARASLDAAEKLHQASKNNFVSDQLLTSAQMARRAREAILKSIQLAKRETRLEENAYKAIERAAKRNEQARTLYDEARTDNNMPARKLIDESLNQLLRARGSIREHMFEVSIQSANASYDMSNRAIALLKKDSVGPELVRREITRTDRLLERIDERAAQGGPQLDTNSLINDAHLLQNRARAHATEGRYILAFEETKQAREIARRIINRSGVGPETGRDAVASTLETTDLLIDRAFELARENQDDRAVRQLEEAARIQREAHDFFRNGQPDRALALTQRAREMAQKAARAMQKEISDDSVRQALERTDQILSRLREALDQSASDSATELYDRALARQNAARESFESGDLRKALANTKVARNLASTALQQIENGQI
jgi:hypothetical protein